MGPAPQRRKETTWKEFIRAHQEVLAATDFFTAEVWTNFGLITYYVLLFKELAWPVVFVIVTSHAPRRVADNLVFIGLAPAWCVNTRHEDMRQAGFALVELCALPVPESWPQFGIELTAGWARRGWQGAIAHTRIGRK